MLHTPICVQLLFCFLISGTIAVLSLLWWNITYNKVAKQYKKHAK